MVNMIFRIALPFFAVMNALLFYLFWLIFPYSWLALEKSFMLWGQLTPPDLNNQGVIVGFIAALVALVVTAKLPRDLKTKLVFTRKEHAHPGGNIFIGGRDPGFDRKRLFETYPAVKDSAYDPKVQFEVWEKLRDKHIDKDIVFRPRKAWHVMRDLFIMSLIFIAIFLVIWLYRISAQVEVPLQVVLNYIFVLGAQALFLMFGARSVANRYSMNVLAAELGYKLGDQPEDDNEKKSFKP